MKLIIYNPKEYDFPKMCNKELDSSDNEEFVMFIFEDIYNNAKDFSIVEQSYINLLKTYKLPFAFFPYYIHFNKILPGVISKPCPRIQCFKEKTHVFDVVNNPGYGMLILNKKMLNSINFKFNEEYKLSFYIQDLINVCYENNLYISNSSFIDVPKSYEMFNSNFKDGYVIPVQKFIQEKELFYKKNKINLQPLDKFIKSLKNIYGVKK